MKVDGDFFLVLVLGLVECVGGVEEAVRGPRGRCLVLSLPVSSARPAVDLEGGDAGDVGGLGPHDADLEPLDPVQRPRVVEECLAGVGGGGLFRRREVSTTDQDPVLAADVVDCSHFLRIV